MSRAYIPVQLFEMLKALETLGGKPQIRFNLRTKIVSAG